MGLVSLGMGDEQDVSAVSGLLDVAPFSGGCDLGSGEDIAAEGEQGFVEGGAFGGLVVRFVFFPRRSCFDNGVEGVLVHGCDFGLQGVGIRVRGPFWSFGRRGWWWERSGPRSRGSGGWLERTGPRVRHFGSGVGHFGEVYGDRFLVCW